MILLRNYFVDTTKDVDVFTVIHEVNRTIREAQVSEGSVNITVPGPGAALSIVEPLPDIVAQLKNAVAVFPGAGMDTKNRRKEEIAIWPRVASAMLCKSVQIPLSKGRLILAPREEPVIIDMETSGLRREFYVQVTGEGGPQAQQVGRQQQPQKRKA